MSVLAHVVQPSGETVRYAAAEAGGLDSATEVDGRWLRNSLRRGDEIVILVDDVPAPDPWLEGDPAIVEEPDAPCGLEVLLNGEPFGRATVGERGAVVALVTWMKGVAGADDDEAYVTLDLHPQATATLSRGDRVVIRLI